MYVAYLVAANFCFRVEKTIFLGYMHIYILTGCFQMGYAHFSQRGKGLHLRQYSRAFIIDDNVKRAVFISVDGAMVAHTIKRDVSE